MPSDKSTRLVLDVSHHRSGDWRLVVKANGQQLYGGVVGPTTAKGGWLTESIDLTRFAGQQVALELQNQATGWFFEWGYWGRVQIVSESKTDTQIASASKFTLTAKESFSLKQHTAAVRRAVFHRTLPLLASVSADGQALLWNLETRAAPLVIHKFGHPDVWAVKFSPDGQWLAVANRNWRDGSRMVVKTLAGVDAGKAVAFKNGGGAVPSIAYSPDGRLFAASQDDGTIRLWETSPFQEFPAVSLGASVWSVAFGPVTYDRKRVPTYLLAVGCQDGTVKTLRATAVKDKTGMRRVFGTTSVAFPKQQGVTCVRFSHDGKLLGATRIGGLVSLYDPQTGVLRREMQATSGNADWISFHPQQPWISTAHWNDRVGRIWDQDTGAML